MKKKILFCFMIMITLFSLIACSNSIKESNLQEESTTGKLQILKSDLKLTQDQVLSQIKAKYLLENNGYKDDDEIIVLVKLSDEALIDSYIEDYSEVFNSLSEYSSSVSGNEQKEKINRKQEKLIETLNTLGLINEVEYNYNTLINGIAIKTKYGNLSKIEEMKGVEKTIISDTYNRPLSIEDEAVTNVVDVYATGIFDSSSVTYTGEGTAVAVLDSGFDCSHSVFSHMPEKEMLTQQNITSVLEQTNAKVTTKDLELFDVYYSKKIPFVYDYADKDPDVSPYDSEHGTHVAGIIGGSDDVITGVAVNTQLVLLKVFPDLAEGAETADILAALEDACLLGVDAINMSLGSACGFAREEDGNAINEVYDKIYESGISLITAASNSYSSGYGGEQGNTNLVTNPDSGTVGSPSTYEASLSVASISGVKSKFIVGNDSQMFFYKESNSITGKENDFMKELGIGEGESKEFEYVTIPGVGLKVNYSSIGDITGKIALVRRGDNTFEEKALNAKNAGAAACIIYNNIDGDILMSMGKTDHIPTISISKDDGTVLASKDTGKLVISNNYQAGPFMSDFSSWGPSPSLELKPEITAHGGKIKSSIPGGGYDELSGTSMATPNLCGIVVLIRQYIKEKYPEYSPKEITALSNQLLMSSATIILNEEGNPYSPRKQGAGLASLYNAVNTKAYISVDGSDRSKLELFDDKNRSGVYTMNFNIVNLSSETIDYDLSIVGMTESVSTSDKTHVSETPYILSDNAQYEVIRGGTQSGNSVTIKGNETAKVKVVYTLSDDNKKYIDELFPYGMYVEGFVKLDTKEGIDLNVPFLAFYGDWTQAPMFDKTYYEVESEAHNKGIDDENKIKADYYATTPYGSYYYNYIIPLGTYLYDIDEERYDAIPASLDHIAISNTLATIDGISAVYAGLLRNAKTMKYTIIDKLTGEEVYSYTADNSTKAYSNGATPIPNYEYLKIKSYDLHLINNREYEFSMAGLLDYEDGGALTNVRNTFSFDFCLDDEAPILRDVSYEKIYDKTLKKNRYYINMTVYDNQYVQSITPINFTSSSSYAFLTDNPIPVYSEKGKDNKVRFEITDYLKDLYADKVITSSLAFSIDDYALNSNIYLCELPGTEGDFKFTKDGTIEGTDLVILSMYEDEVVDLTTYLATKDESVYNKNINDNDKDYLKYLVWESSNEKVAVVKEGLVQCLKAGKATITVQEAMNLKQAIVIINVKERDTDNDKKTNGAIENSDEATIEELRFSYFDTLFAYSRAAQTSEIGETGDRLFLNSMTSINFYPGEKIKLFYDFDPWYVMDKYKLSYSSTNESVAVVDEEGVVTALKKGSANIVLSVEGSNIKARVKLTVKSEFIIENRMLVAYKGLGGDVIIPDDEGILYIGAYAFCLYNTDREIELTEDDYDANKIPSMNTSVKSVVVPDGVEDIQKYAFYNCSGLEKVVIPESCKYVRECCFYNDEKLTDVNLENIKVIGREAFKGCKKLKNVDLSNIYAIGVRAFDDCESLEKVDLTTLRNTGSTAFRNCKNLQSVVLSEDTKLSYAMFVNCGFTTLDIYEKVQIPAFCFAKCAKLTKVTLHNDFTLIDEGAFSECLELTDFEIRGNLDIISEETFYMCPKLESITLPNCAVTLGNYCFYKCEKLNEVVLQENTYLSRIDGSIFEDTALNKFTLKNNKNYTTDENYLLSNDGKTIVLALAGREYEDLVIDGNITKIGDGAFCGTNVISLTITNPNTTIGTYAFANCDTILTVTLPNVSGLVIKDHAFNYCSKLETVNNLDKVLSVGDYAFANTYLPEVSIASNSKYGEGAFFKSKVTKVTIGENSTFGLGAFQYCDKLITVKLSELGNIHFGKACFAYDTNLKSFNFESVDSIIEDETFYGCTSLQVVKLENVVEIGEYAFSDCKNITYISLPKVVTIKEGAFSRNAEYGGAPQITGIELPNTLKTLGDGVFIGCEGLLEVTLPSSLVNVGDYLFAYCVHLSKVTIPSTIKKITKYSFAGCKILTDINLENVEEIDDYAFTSSEILETVDLTNVKSIGEGSFAGTNLKGELTCNVLKTIGMYAFQNTSLTKFTANNLEVIGEGAFQHNHKLKEFVFTRKIRSIDLLAFHDCLSLTSYYYLDGGKRMTTGTINNYARLYKGSLYTMMESGKLQLTSVPTGMNIDILDVLEGTYRIDTYAGNENKNISSVRLPSTLKSIGNYAFFGYSDLNLVEFTSCVAPKLEDSYNRNSELIEDDPGYNSLHEHYNLFGYELYYYTFIDLVGKNKPIRMTLPENENLVGYDSLVYEVYFGKVSEAKKNGRVAMETDLETFIEMAKIIQKIDVITMNEEKIISSAITSLNRIEQPYSMFEITEEEWNGYLSDVYKAKAAFDYLKLINSGTIIVSLQNTINSLPEKFSIEYLETLRDINDKLSELKKEDKAKLDLTKYNLINKSYTEYQKEILSEADGVVKKLNSSVDYISIIKISTLALGAIYLFFRREGR